MVTVIYSWSLSNYLREGKDEDFDWFGLNRFGGGPEGGLGGSIDARGPRPLSWRLLVWHCWQHWFLRDWFQLLLRCKVLAPDKGLCSDTFLSLPLEPGFHFINNCIVLLKPFLKQLKASEAHSGARIVSFAIHSFVQDRKIWSQWFEILDVSDSKLRRFLIKISIVQPCWSHKRIGINRRLLWPARPTGQLRAHGICNNSWIANYRF